MRNERKEQEEAFQFNANGKEAIKEIQDATDTPSESDVVRDAIELYMALVKAAREQKLVYVGTSRETVIPVRMSTLERAAKKALERK